MILEEYKKDIFVRHWKVAEALCKAGYFKNLKSVKQDRIHPGYRIYFFDNIPEIRKLVDREFENHKERIKSIEEVKSINNVHD